MNYIITLLMVIASGAYYLGGVSYIAVGLLILINLVKNELPSSRYLMMLCFSLLFVFNLTQLQNLASFDLVALNFFLQIIFLLSIDFRKEAFIRCIFTSLKIQLTISVVLCVFGVLTDSMGMFVDAGSAKGFSGLYAARGIFSTPQLLSSVCLAILVFGKYGNLVGVPTKRNFLFFLSIMAATINRVNIIGLLSVLFISIQKSNRKYFVYTLNVLLVSVFSVIVLSLDFDRFMSIQTIESRALLLDGVINSINTDSIISVVFGDFEKIYFYIPQYLMGVTYVENGFLFLLKYFGVVGLLSYIIICALLVYKINSQCGLELTFYTFFYLFIVQNFTNEFLVIIYPEIIALMIYSSYQIRNKNILQTL